MHGGESGKRGRHRLTCEGTLEVILEVTLGAIRENEMILGAIRESEMILGTAGETGEEMPTEEEMLTGAEMRRGAERYDDGQDGRGGRNNAGLE